MIVTSLYTAILGILFFILSLRVIQLRRRLQIGLGDAGNEDLLRAISVQANLAEYAPIALLLMYFLEVQINYSWLIHLLGIILILGRISHAYGVGQSVENYKFRVFGMASTFTVIILISLFLLLLFIQQFVQ